MMIRINGMSDDKLVSEIIGLHFMVEAERESLDRKRKHDPHIGLMVEWMIKGEIVNLVCSSLKSAPVEDFVSTVVCLIGLQLHVSGGFDRMKKIADMVDEKSMPAGEWLSVTWDEVGDWYH
tara:strand:- start:257 stop:619 length:363 start_codon:yes stop_codon:yes gene_type:complete